MKKSPLIGIVVFIFFLFIALSPYSFFDGKINQLNAEVVIKNYEHIKNDTIWTAEKGPYLIEGFSRVFNGVKLTIKQGTIVKLYEKAALYTSGELIIEGAEESPVIFTSIYDDEVGSDNSPWTVQSPKPGSWGTLGLQDGGNLTIDHAVFKYGGLDPAWVNGLKAGVIFAWSGAVNITNSEFTENIRALNNYWNYYPVSIHNSKIYNNQLGGIRNNSYVMVDAVNNWWGHNSGPYHETLNPDGQGDAIQGIGRVHILFDPWIGKKEKKDPVIIVPGIMGSYLYNQIGEEVWPAIDKMIVDPWDNYLNELTLPGDGIPIGNSILMPDGIFRKIVNKDFFQGLIDELVNNGYQEGENLFVFPYDWRWDLNWTAGVDPIPQVQSLAEKVIEVKNQTGADKVNIIAHSMGGLIAKKYIKDYGDNSVNKFIDIATPHLGAPKAFKILMYGDDMNLNVLGRSILNPERIKNISQNFPSVYQLLPSQNYFSEDDQDYAYYIYDMHDLDNNGIKGRLNYDQSIEFMKNTGRNEHLLGFNNTLHSNLDNYSPQQDNITTFNIVGCGSPTIGQIFVMNKDKSGKYEYGLKYINGDETVPLRSAGVLAADDTYFAIDAKHAYLPSANGVRQLISAMLKGEQDSFNYQDYNNLTKDLNNCGFSGTQISFHSPIELHVYDENNNHLGPDTNGDIEMGIEGAQYDIIENNKFAFLPEGHIYKIIGKATGAGSFNARIQTVNNNQYEQTVYYNEVPLDNVNANVQFTICDNQEDYQMQIDQDGDQSFEQVIEPSSILNQTESQDLVKPETELIITGERSIDNKYINNVLAELTAKDNKDGSGVLKTEYSLDSGQTWIIYKEPFILDQAGEHSILYNSTDRAGNIEEAKELIIEIKNINIETVIKEIEMFYNKGMITKKMVERQLINKLNWIKKYIGRYGKKEIRREKIFVRILEKCEQRKPENWCEEKLVGKFDKTGYKLNQIHQKIIIKQYQSILKLLKHYSQKQWISDWAYAIIKEDIEYLINNL
ncbi:MAG: alpha/beta hydrolase [bacterium]|nr:alpha/beta hydrolase [bacterium]